jgi:hypothetical protein
MGGIHTKSNLWVGKCRLSALDWTAGTVRNTAPRPERERKLATKWHQDSAH